MFPTYLIFVGFLWRLHDNGTSCSGEWPSLAVISSPGHWNWFSSSHEESKYASCPDSPMSIRWHRKQIMGMAQLLGHSLWQHQEEENVFGQFPSVLWYNLVQKHIYCGLRSDRLFWGCVKKWVIGGFILPLPVKVRSSMCHRREYTRQDLSAHIWWGWALYYCQKILAGVYACVCVYIYVCLWFRVGEYTVFAWVFAVPLW